MKFVFSFIFIIFFFSTNTLFAQSNHIEFKRVKPKGWFSILVPPNSVEFYPHGSVDGGDIDSKELMVEFHYWQNANAPLYMKRDSNTVSTRCSVPKCDGLDIA